MKKIKWFLPLLFFFLPFTASAHQPRLIMDRAGELIEVKKAEISQAFYGELQGQGQDFIVKSEETFELYVNVLSPDIPEATQDFSLAVYKKLANGNDLLMFTLLSNEKIWTKYYEPFGGDSYFMGPEKTIELTKGEYVIKLANPNMKGKYVLAVGKKESFPPVEMIRTLITLPKLKAQFFGKSPLTAYFNYSGLFLLFLIILIIALIWFGPKGWRYFRKRLKRAKEEKS